MASYLARAAVISAASSVMVTSTDTSTVTRFDIPRSCRMSWPVVASLGSAGTRRPIATAPALKSRRYRRPSGERGAGQVRPTSVASGAQRLALLSAVLGTAFAACGGSSGSLESSAAPPTVVCGTTLNATASGAVMYDATKRLPAIDAPSSRGLIFIRVADGCATGAVVAWSPKRAATLVDQATAKDGTTVAVVLQPASPHVRFTVTATRNGKRVATAVVRLGG